MASCFSSMDFRPFSKASACSGATGAFVRPCWSVIQHSEFWANGDILASTCGAEFSSSFRHQRAAVDETSFVELFVCAVWVRFLGFAALFPIVLPGGRNRKNKFFGASKCPRRACEKIGPLAIVVVSRTPRAEKWIIRAAPAR